METASLQKPCALSTEVGQYKTVDAPRFQPPIQVGVYSTDKCGGFHDDSSSLKYYYKKAADDVRRKYFDLNIGFEDTSTGGVEDDLLRGNLDNLLHWLNRHKMEVAADGANRLDCDFVCWRGLLTRLLCCVYDHRDDWIIAVTLHRGTYYLREYETEQNIQARLRQSPRDARMCYWGQKFEQYCVTKTRDGEPVDPNQPLCTAEQFCSIVRSKLDNHSLLFGGEVDCCDPDDNTRYVELKTNRMFTHHRQEQNFARNKLLKWWAQSFLIGIPEVVGGFRDDDGMVRHLKTYQTRQMPSMAGNWWDPVTSLTFTKRFLQFVKDNVKTDDPRSVCLMRHDANAAVIKCQVCPAGSKFTFLPDWYINAT